MATYEIGDRVRLLIDSPTQPGEEATIKVINNPNTDPGRQIGVELDHFFDYGHSLEGVVEEREDEQRGITIGKGWWTRPEYIEKV